MIGPPMSDPSRSETSLDHAWRYFELHATQRMSVFNFFLVLSGLIAAGFAASIEGSPRLAPLGVALGLLLALVSFVFWKLDQRVSFLIKCSEKALAEIELALPDECVRLFRLEPKHTESVVHSGHWWTRHWTYGTSFRFVFLVMGLFGVGGALVSVLCFVGIVSW